MIITSFILPGMNLINDVHNDKENYSRKNNLNKYKNKAIVEICGNLPDAIVLRG